MVGSTQDIAAMAQLVIIGRYITQGKIYERFLRLTVLDNTTE